MFAVEHRARSVFRHEMTDRQRSRPSEAQIYGTALRRLRQARGLSQLAAAELANTHQQSWQRYEAAENNALLKTTLQRRLAEAIGASHGDFLLEVDRLTEAAPRANRSMGDFEFPMPGRVRASPQGLHIFDEGEPGTMDISHLFGRSTRIMQVAGESMVPYVFPGSFVAYNIGQPPRRGEGCVVETTSGDYYIKLYDRTVGGTLYVTELHPKEKELRFDLAEVRGLHAVVIRGG